MIAELNHKTVKTENEVRIENEVDKTKDFSQSDHFIGRNISCLIKLSWTEEEVRTRAAKMAELIKANL